MSYAATPAAQPDAAAATTPAEEGRAPPTIDSHGGKLTPLTSSYLEPTSSVLILGAILSLIAPRRLKAFGGVDLNWLRLAPGLLLSAVVAWNLLPSPRGFSSPGLDHYLLVTAWVTGAMLAFTFLNLVADALFPTGQPSAPRSFVAVIASTLALLILLGLWTVDWYGTGAKPAISIDPTPALVSLMGAPLGLGLLLLWRRFQGWVFELAAAIGVLGSIMLAGWLLPFGNGISGVTVNLVALTVATMVGFGLRGMGAPGWQTLSGRAVWAWAWILRAILIAGSVSIATF